MVANYGCVLYMPGIVHGMREDLYRTIKGDVSMDSIIEGKKINADFPFLRGQY